MEVCDDYEWYVKDKYCQCGPKPWMECHPYYGNDCLQWKYDEKMGRDVMKNPYQKEEWYSDNKMDHMEGEKEDKYHEHWHEHDDEGKHEHKHNHEDEDHMHHDDMKHGKKGHKKGHKDGDHKGMWDEAKEAFGFDSAFGFSTVAATAVVATAAMI